MRPIGLAIVRPLRPRESRRVHSAETRNDGSGLCLYYKRRDRGSFRVPEAFEEGATSRTLDDRELADLLYGLDVELPKTRTRRKIH